MSLYHRERLLTALTETPPPLEADLSYMLNEIVVKGKGQGEFFR